MMTMSEVIEAWGGTAATARLFSVTMSAVSNWKANGHFPARLHLRVYRECRARGIDYDPSAPAALEHAPSAAGATPGPAPAEPPPPPSL